MSKCSPKKYSTDARDPETNRKIQAFSFSCITHKIYGKTFRTKSARDRFADAHLAENVK